MTERMNQHTSPSTKKHKNVADMFKYVKKSMNIIGEGIEDNFWKDHNGAHTGQKWVWMKNILHEINRLGTNEKRWINLDKYQ